MKFLKESEFRDTSIGKIPRDWQILELRKLGLLHDGDWILKEDYSRNGVRLLQVGDIGVGSFVDKSSRFITMDRAKELRCTFVEANEDILISRMPDPIGRACLAPSLPYPYIVAVDITIFKTRKDISNLIFVTYLLNSSKILNEVKNHSAGATRQRISRKSLERITIPLPPLSEQKSIAEVLSVVDSAIELVNRVIWKTERLKKGLMQELLTKGIGHTEYKDTPIGKTPKTWQIVKLEEASEVIMGQSPPGETYNEKGEGTPLINGPTEFGEKYPIKAKWTTSPTKLTKENDVLICVRGHTTGRLCVSDDAYCIGRGVAAIRGFKQRISNIFLYYVLEKNQSKIFRRSYAAGSTFPNVTRDQLGKVLIPLPSLPEQRKISGILNATDNKLQLEKAEKMRLERVKRGLMDLLLTGKVRVRVD